VQLWLCVSRRAGVGGAGLLVSLAPGRCMKASCKGIMCLNHPGQSMFTNKHATDRAEV
jgi:hypothetical protein